MSYFNKQNFKILDYQNTELSEILNPTATQNVILKQYTVR